MPVTLSSPRNFACAFVVAFATVACGGSAPPAATAPQTVDATEASSSEGSQVASSSSAAETVVDGSESLDFRFTPGGGLVLNGVPLSEKTRASELTKRLGAPSREQTYPSGEVGLFYDEQGLVLWTVGEDLKGVGMNFNWDGDKKFPETSFTGSLMVGELKVEQKTTQASFQALEGDGISCLDDSMCGGGSASTRFLVGFEKSVITQVSFLLSKK